jgi:hypothetical protein
MDMLAFASTDKNDTACLSFGGFANADTAL